MGLRLTQTLAGFVLGAGCLSGQDPGPAHAPVPPPGSAYIQSLVVDPTQPAILYAASPGGGLYRTSNGGDFWESIAPAADLRHFNAIAISPSDPSRLFTGGQGTGLWTSADQGRNWAATDFPGPTVLDLAIDPGNPLRVFVLAPDGVYRTDHAPAGPWTRVFSYPGFLSGHRKPDWPPDSWELNRFQGITVNPHDPRVITVGARWEGGYHRSDDGGETWTHQTLAPIFRRVDRVHFDPEDPAVLYAATHHQGLFKSQNHGQSWVSMNRGLAPQKRTPWYGVVLISGLAFDPDNARTLYAGSDYSNWKSTDAGRTWQELGITLTCEFARSFAVAPGNPPTVYAGTNVGIYRSSDAGATWESCNRGLPTREIIATCEGRIGDERFQFAAVRGRPAVYRRSLTRGTDWVSISWMLHEDVHALRFDSGEGTLIIATGSGEYHSVDGGLRWDVPAVAYAPRPIPDPVSNFEDDALSADEPVVPVVVTGAPVPDDATVDPLYRRPPYISLQLVGPGYPLDGSVPFASGQWDSSLSGLFRLPPGTEASGRDDLLLYVEVRDFQWGTLTGSAPLDPQSSAVAPERDPPRIHRVQVDLEALLPSLQEE